jgi:hypothetical protein
MVPFSSQGVINAGMHPVKIGSLMILMGYVGNIGNSFPFQAGS